MMEVTRDDTVLAMFSIVVAAIYFVIGGYIFPRLVLSWRAMTGAGLFFVGCALSHIHWATDLLVHAHAHGTTFMFLAHVMQVVGGAIFIWELHHKRIYMATTSSSDKKEE